MRTDFATHWDELAAEVLSGMKEWRLQHAEAPLREFEGALNVAKEAAGAHAAGRGVGQCGG